MHSPLIKVVVFITLVNVTTKICRPQNPQRAESFKLAYTPRDKWVRFGLIVYIFRCAHLEANSYTFFRSL